MDERPRNIYSDSLGTEIYDVLGPAISTGSPMGGDVEFYRRAGPFSMSAVEPDEWRSPSLRQATTWSELTFR